MSLSFFQQVQPKAGTPGVAADPSAPSGAQQGPGPNPLMTFLPFLILIPFLFLSFRRQKKEQAQRASLKKGDRVVTNAGLIGELMELDEKIAKVKIAPGTTVQVLATALTPFETTAEKTTKSDKDLEDLKDAKSSADKK